MDIIKAPESFFKEEKRQDYKISSKMKKIWNIEIELLQVLLDICKKNNLKCWVDSGTLIGAVRDNGFIPWDDDIDMVMMRNDFNKLSKIIVKELEFPYFFETIATDRFCRYKTAKLMKAGTTANINDSKGRQCIFIDIFVYDAVPTKLGEINKYLLNVKLSREFCNVFNKISDLLPEFIYKKFPLKLMLNKWFVKKLSKYDILDTYYIALSSLHYKTPLRRKLSYTETIYKKFEYIEVPVPKGYNEILSLEYGDYMKPQHTPTRHGKVEFNVDD